MYYLLYLEILSCLREIKDRTHVLSFYPGVYIDYTNNYNKSLEYFSHNNFYIFLMHFYNIIYF